VAGAELGFFFVFPRMDMAGLADADSDPKKSSGES
jgi:hypothetical protein